jgi:hypothetical protein
VSYFSLDDLTDSELERWGGGGFLELVVPVNEAMRTTAGGRNRCGLERQVLGTHFIRWGDGSQANVES